MEIVGWGGPLEWVEFGVSVGQGLVAGGESLLATSHRLCGCSDSGHYCLGPLQGVLLGRTVCVCVCVWVGGGGGGGGGGEGGRRE